MTNHEQEQTSQGALLATFEFEGVPLSIEFDKTVKVADGVVCDVYVFEDDVSKDLGIIRLQPGAKTPLQNVLQGERTIEGHISGKGTLTVTRGGRKTDTYDFDDENEQRAPVEVMIGDVMQWYSSSDSELTAYEICFPPYQDGRYEEIK